MKKILKNAFTLVELIVVITIIAVLATIGFISFTWYNVQVRDSVRLSDIKTVYTWVNVYKAKHWKVPVAVNQTEIQIGWETIQYQSNLEAWILGQVSITQWMVDPKTKELYTYVTDKNSVTYQVWAILEIDNPDYAFWNTTYALHENLFYSKWWRIWIIEDNTWSFVHKVATVFNLDDAVWEVTAYFYRWYKFTWTWPELINEMQE